MKIKNLTAGTTVGELEAANARIAELEARLAEADKALAETLDDSHEHVTSLMQRVARLEAALKAVEWVPNGEGWNNCPWCNAYEEYGDGHKPDCPRQSVLRLAIQEREEITP